jgi:hypothetical protein
MQRGRRLSETLTPFFSEHESNLCNLHDKHGLAVEREPYKENKRLSLKLIKVFLIHPIMLYFSRTGLTIKIARNLKMTSIDHL